MEDFDTFSNRREYSDSNLNKNIKIEEKTNSRNSKKKKKYFLLLVIIILIILIIIIIILLCYFLLRKKKLNNINKTQTSNNEIICESGFYLPSDDPLAQNCSKCSIENCIECYGSKLKDICTKCNPEFKEIYINNKIESCEIPCEEGINEKCKQCDKDDNKCLSCNDGYYLPEFEKNKCQKCSIENCLECYGNKTSNLCIKCNPNLKEGYENDTNETIISCKLTCEEGDEEKCKKCDNIRNECFECNIGYKLVNNKCILNYSFKAIYKQNTINEETILIKKGSISELIIDGNKVKEPLSNYYYFNDTESHEVYILINMEQFGKSLYNLFADVDKMISISFTSLFNTSNITIMNFFFIGCSNLESINNIYHLDVRKVKSMSYFFRGCSSLKSIDLSSFDTKSVTDLSGMFYDCSSLTSINLSSFDTKNVTDLSYMFTDCSSLTSIDLSNFDTKNVNDLEEMFSGCSSLISINLSSFDTQNAKDLFKMFFHCSSLKSIDLSSFDTKSVTDMGGLFFGCSSLTSINLSNFDTKNNTSLKNMFSGCFSLTSVDLSNFDTQKVTNLDYMFMNCSSLTSIDLSNFNTNQIPSITSLFNYCGNLKFINIANFNISSTVKLFNHIYARNGTIIANQNIYNNLDTISKDSLSGWIKKYGI